MSRSRLFCAVLGSVVALASAAVFLAARRAQADPPPAAKPAPSWWATYAGMKVITDDYDPQNSVPIRPGDFFRKYPAAHKAVWKRSGIDPDRIEHRVLAIGVVGRHLDKLLGETAFDWPADPAAVMGWWAKDVLGPVADAYGDYLAPRSLDNADLDAAYRVVHGRPAGAPLSDEDRRVGIIRLSQQLNEKYHADALRDPKLLGGRDAKLLAAWRARKVLATPKPPALADLVATWSPAVEGATVAKFGGVLTGANGPRVAAHTFDITGATFAAVWDFYAAKCGMADRFDPGKFRGGRQQGGKDGPSYMIAEHETRPGERVSVFTYRASGQTVSVSIQPKGVGDVILCILTVVADQ